MNTLLNYQKLAEKIKNDLLREQEISFTGFPFTHNSVDFEIKGDFIIFYGQIYNSENEFKCKHYTSKVYSVNFLSYVYSDSNVTGIDSIFTFDEIFNKCKNQTIELNKMLNNLN